MRNTMLIMMILLIAVGTGLSHAAVAATSGNIYPPDENVYGKSLGEWLEAYWRWYYSDEYPDPDQDEPLAFLPLPNGVDTKPNGKIPYYQGTIEVTITEGTGFVLPLFSWNWEKYADGSDDSAYVIPDAQVPSTVSRSGGSTNPPIIMLDDRPILQKNFWTYYTGTCWLNPTINYLEPTNYGSTGIIALQTAGFVSAPLTPGTHKLWLREEMDLSQYGIHYVVDNTWIINVVPED